MESNSQQISLDMNELNSFITAINAINERNPGISSFTLGAADCLPICIRMERPPPPPPPPPPPAAAISPENNLGKTMLGLTFQAVLALFISTPNSSPPLLTHLFGAAVLISFVLSLARFYLQNAYPRIGHLFEKIGAFFAAIGVCIMASLLIHQNFA